jgi:hypothetical protein
LRDGRNKQAVTASGVLPLPTARVTRPTPLPAPPATRAAHPASTRPAWSRRRTRRITLRQAPGPGSAVLSLLGAPLALAAGSCRDHHRGGCRRVGSSADLQEARRAHPLGRRRTAVAARCGDVLADRPGRVRSVALGRPMGRRGVVECPPSAGARWREALSSSANGRTAQAPGRRICSGSGP